MRQFGRFALVGVGNTACSWVAYPALLAVGVAPATAAAGAFAAGALNGYVWNSRWTFRARGLRLAPLRYLLVQLAGLGTTSALVWLLAPPAGRYPAYALATAVVTVATFCANRWWTFARPAERSQPILSPLTEPAQRGVMPWMGEQRKGHAR